MQSSVLNTGVFVKSLVLDWRDQISVIYLLLLVGGGGNGSVWIHNCLSATHNGNKQEEAEKEEKKEGKTQIHIDLQPWWNWWRWLVHLRRTRDCLCWESIKDPPDVLVIVCANVKWIVLPQGNWDVIHPTCVIVSLKLSQNPLVELGQSTMAIPQANAVSVFVFLTGELQCGLEN